MLHQRHIQTSKMKILTVIVNGLKSLAIFTRSSVLDILGDPKYISVHTQYDPKITSDYAYSDACFSNT